MADDYRLARAVSVRLMGLALTLAGGAVLGVGVLVVLGTVASSVLSVAVPAAALLVLLVAVALARRTVVVRLDETGYVVRWVRGVGVPAARWKDVEDVVATTVAGERCVVLRLRDGRSTTVPVRLLEGPDAAFVTDLQSRLDRGHGYRPLR